MEPADPPVCPEDLPVPAPGLRPRCLQLRPHRPAPGLAGPTTSGHSRSACCLDGASDIHLAAAHSARVGVHVSRAGSKHPLPRADSLGGRGLAGVFLGS